MIFLDSSLFAAAARERDPDFAKARDLLMKLHETHEALLTSDHVLDEVVTFLRRRESAKTAVAEGRRMLANENLQVLLAQPEDAPAVLALVERFGFLSYCDALNLVLMKKHRVSRIASFDSDFDRVPGVQRVP